MGLDEDVIKRYVKYQEKEERWEEDQVGTLDSLSLTEKKATAFGSGCLLVGRLGIRSSFIVMSI